MGCQASGHLHPLVGGEFPILVATLSTNGDQVNWHYKSAQRYGSGTMPAEYKLYDSMGHACTCRTARP